MRHLVRNRLGPDDRGNLTGEEHVVLDNALASMSEGETDRFWRARRVWFNFTTESFEFEDSYLLSSDL